MELNSVRKAGIAVLNGLSRNSPAILTSLGVGGFVTTVFLAIDATPKAMALINDERQILFEKTEDPDIQLTPMETAKVVWKVYLPTAIVGVGSIGCIIAANLIANRRYAALAGIYSLTDSTFKEYQAKVVETLGKGKDQKVRDEIAQDKLIRDPVTKKEVIVTGKGSTLCYDVLSGRYFMSDIESLRKVQNEFNHQLLAEWRKTLNELYFDMGLEGIKMGQDVGWTTDQMLEFRFTSKLTDDGKPCVVIEYKIEPHNI